MRLGDTFRFTAHALGIHYWPKRIHDRRVWLPIDGFYASELLSPGSLADLEDGYFRDLLGHIGPSDTVFDIGAHRGLFASLAAPRCRHLYAFEPSKKNRRFLASTLDRNGLANTTIVPKAIGVEAGEVPFWEHGSGSSTVCHDPEHAHLSTAEMMRLDDFEPSATVVKIDVEGAEADVIESGARKLASTQVIGVEVHPEKLRKFGRSDVDVTAALELAGFPGPHRRYGTDRSVYMLIGLRTRPSSDRQVPAEG